MAPSRGSGVLHLSRRSLSTLALRPGVCASSGSRRGFASFTDKLSDPANKLQSYVSTSNDPFLNLSIEHHILQKSPPDSTVLFLYVNRPCVVIGRNQNPWTEVNLAMLNAPPPTSLSANAVDLVRRRSGGGTVFHDHGNLNWSITCPRNHFTRDKHAEMVVRALRKLGVSRARVNERHDIVLDQGHEQQPSDPDDTHRTPYTLDPDALPRALKVSGSAYKLTRLRALHHATTLLSSPNLAIIPQYLHSPAKAFIQAKGVESVSSPVANIGLQVVPFQRHLQAEFAQMYAQGRQPDVVATVGDDHLQVPDIRKGYDELRTEDWMWSQTPQFDLQLQPNKDIGVNMNIHHGIIKSLDMNDSRLSAAAQTCLRSMLLNQKLQDISKWTTFLQKKLGNLDKDTLAVAKRMDEILPIPKLP